MPCSWGFIALLACWLLQYQLVEANPSLDFPVNAQVPPVARLSQPYIFVFSASTFTSTDGPISYSLSGQPSWLELISGTRTFSGMPGPEDAGSAAFDLVASDSTGSTTASVTLVVIASSGPGNGQPVLPQLSKAGPTSGPASLILRPLQNFAFTFETETFSNITPNTEFYAVSANNTPLPNWVQFDPARLGFSGISPPLVSPTAMPQIYGIRLLASDVVGFSEADVEFQLIVGYHILTSTDVTQQIHITAEQKFASDQFRKTLTLDGQSVADSDLNSVTSNAPGWVDFDPGTISLNGVAPSATKSTNVTIIITDVYGDVLNIVVELIAALESSALFTGTLPDANATAGQSFSYTVNANLLRDGNVKLSANLGSSSTWLGFSAQNRTFHGTVPKNLNVPTETITLTASEGTAKDESSFVIDIASVQHSPSSPTKTTSSTRTTTSIATAVIGSAGPQPGSGQPLMSNSNIAKIVLATVLPAVLIVLIIFLVLCWRRKHSRQGQRRHSASQEVIVRPEARSTPEPEVMEVPLVPRTPERSPRPSTLSQPPQIELPWLPDSMRNSKHRMSKTLRAKPVSSETSTWGDFVVAGTGPGISRRPESIRTVNATESVSHDVPSLRNIALNYSRKRSTRLTNPKRAETIPKRSSKRYSTLSLLSVGLPQRLSGAGHGAGGAPPAQFNEARSSWQTTFGSMRAGESRPSTIVLDDFPSPGRDKSSGVLQARSSNRPPPRSTVRMVQNDSTWSSDLQKFHTDRVRDRLEGSARFSNAPSRLSSKSRELWDGGRTGSTAFMSDSEGSARNTLQSLSRWSGGGRAELAQRLRGSAYVRTPSTLRRDVRTGSSGQYDSASSTDSWEDDIEEENEEGCRHWQRSEAGRTPSPFEAEPASPKRVMSPVVPPPRLRLANRNPVSVDNRQTRRSEEQGQGSLAFV
jgi:axial budding pattern protein 2